MIPMERKIPSIILVYSNSVIQEARSPERKENTPTQRKEQPNVQIIISYKHNIKKCVPFDLRRKVKIVVKKLNKAKEKNTKMGLM